jgi:hypothetical protein
MVERGAGSVTDYTRLSNAGKRKGINTCNQPKKNAGRAIILRTRTEQQKCFDGIFGGILYLRQNIISFFKYT